MALPKYREAKLIIEKQLAEYFERASRKELAPFNESPRITQHEGKTLKHNTLDKSRKQKVMKYQATSVEYRIEWAKVPDMTPEDVLAMLDEKAKIMGSEMAKYHFKVLDETVREAGNVVNAKGQKPSVDLFLETLEKISISFDKDGNPKMPTLVISPKQADDWKKVMDDSKTPEVDARFKRIMEKKKEEYDAEQASRKLVD